MSKRKNEVRDAKLECRNKLDSAQVISKSDLIRKNLYLLKEIKKASVIHCYVSLGNEVETHKLINENKNKIVIPKVFKNRLRSIQFKTFKELKKGEFGILEPANNCTIDDNEVELVIVPGIVFDKKGNRIGYCKGYYDKFLNSLKATKIGLAYDFQIEDSIPTEKHDIKMDYIITEKRIINCKK